MVKTKDCKFELKAVNEDGTFTGYLSVYDVVDLGNDVVKKGAFTKTIQEQKGIVPMLWCHKTDVPLGAFDLTDDDYGLKVDGEFFLKESERAREYHAMSKRYMEKGRPMGMSIGYEAKGGSAKNPTVNGIRQLKEVHLHEGSLTLFPMLPAAMMTDIKSVDGAEQKDFLGELAQAQTYSMRGLIMNSLYTALDSAFYSADDAAEIVQESSDSIDQFKIAYIEHLPNLLALFGVKALPQEKAGRRHSAETLARIDEAIASLQALKADGGTSEEAAEVEEPKAAKQDAVEPELLHSLANFTNEVKESLKWNN